MSGTPDRIRGKARPYLIVGGTDGKFSLSLRDTRFNSQNYPVIVTTPLDETFGTAAAARAFAKEQYGAAAGEFEIQRASGADSDEA
jgi:hypothetical protein